MPYMTRDRADGDCAAQTNTGDGDDRGIGFWIGLDGDNLLYLCEVYEE